MEKTSEIYGRDRPSWDKQDCAVRALATAAGCSYQAASALMSAAGRKLGKGTTRALTISVLIKIGAIEVQDISGIELGHFIKLFPRGSFMVFKRGHAFAVLDGVVHDWDNTSRASTKVEMAWMLTKEAKEKMKAMELLLN